MAKTLLVLIGMPASGKSTYANQWIAERNAVRINQDDLRVMLHTGEWSKKKEQATRAVKFAAIRGALDEGFDVVSDDTNIEPSIRHQLRTIATLAGAIYLEKVVQIDYEQAVERDAKRDRTVGPDVIKKFYLRAIELGVYRD